MKTERKDEDLKESKDLNSDLNDGFVEGGSKPLFLLSPKLIGLIAILVTAAGCYHLFNGYQKKVLEEKVYWENKSKENNVSIDKEKWVKTLFNQRISYFNRINTIVFQYALSLNLTDEEIKMMGISNNLKPVTFQESQAEYLKLKEDYKNFTPSNDGLTQEGMSFYLMKDAEVKDVIESGFAFWDYFFEKASNKENMKKILLGIPQNSSEENFLEACKVFKEEIPKFDIKRISCPN